MLALALAVTAQDKDGLELSIKTDTTVYSGKDPMVLEVQLRNKTDGDRKVTFHHSLAQSLSVLQGASQLRIIGAGCACGTYEAGAVEVTLKAGESRTCTVKAFLLANTKGRHEIRVEGANIRPAMGPSNRLEITLQ